MRYVVVEIAGKQYLAQPGKKFSVNNLGDVKAVEGKVLLLANDKLEVGKPYLSKTLKFEVTGIKKEKLRVAKFHAKANYRRVMGGKNTFSIVSLPSNKPTAVKKS